MTSSKLPGGCSSNETAIGENKGWPALWLIAARHAVSQDIISNTFAIEYRNQKLDRKRKLSGFPAPRFV